MLSSVHTGKTISTYKLKTNRNRSSHCIINIKGDFWFDTTTPTFSVYDDRNEQIAKYYNVILELASRRAKYDFNTRIE